MCLRTCFIEAISIPENNSPVYTMAMRDIVLSVSNLSPTEKVCTMLSLKNIYH